jgi:transcription antitermination factor NusG
VRVAPKVARPDRMLPAKEARGARRAGLGATGHHPSGGSFITEVDPHAPVARGTRVRGLAGPFAGKVGVVQELDGKGGARVMLGLLATRLDVKDLIASAEGRDRPSLSTSHRRPLPSR